MDSYEPATLSKDEAYEFASNERRRSLIRTLIADGAQPLSRVVDYDYADEVVAPDDRIEELGPLV